MLKHTRNLLLCGIKIEYRTKLYNLLLCGIKIESRTKLYNLLLCDIKNESGTKLYNLLLCGITIESRTKLSISYLGVNEREAFLKSVSIAWLLIIINRIRQYRIVHCNTGIILSTRFLPKGQGFIIERKKG